MSDPARGGFSLYMLLVGVVALVTACGCTACALLLSHLHRRRKKQRGGPPEEEGGINNQREFVTLIRNLDRPSPLLAPEGPHTSVPAPSCCEEIELTRAPSPAPTHSSPALKPSRAHKLDISNLEREKLNRIHYADNQEVDG